MYDQLHALGSWYWIFWSYNATLLIIALTSLLLVDSEQVASSRKNRIAKILKIASTRLGNGKLLWFSLFSLSLFFYVDSQSPLFVASFIYSAAILLINPQKALIDMSVARSAEFAEVGRVFGVQAGGIYLAKRIRGSDSVSCSDVVGFRPTTATDNSWKL